MNVDEAELEWEWDKEWIAKRVGLFPEPQFSIDPYSVLETYQELKRRHGFDPLVLNAELKRQVEFHWNDEEGEAA